MPQPLLVGFTVSVRALRIAACPPHTRTDKQRKSTTLLARQHKIEKFQETFGLLLPSPYLEAKSFAQAHSEFDACLKRRGEVTVIWLDDVPSYRNFPPVYYYLGRAQEGLNSPAAVESWKTFLQIKAKGEDDPLIMDARRRLAGR